MTLKTIGSAALIGAVALAFMFGATTARAEYNGGGPIMMGKMCWMGTDALGHGYWANCPKPAKQAMKPKKAKKKKM